MKKGVGSGSAPKCHGSPTLLFIEISVKILWYRKVPLYRYRYCMHKHYYTYSDPDPWTYHNCRIRIAFNFLCGDWSASRPSKIDNKLTFSEHEALQTLICTATVGYMDKNTYWNLLFTLTFLIKREMDLALGPNSGESLNPVPGPHNLRVLKQWLKNTAGIQSKEVKSVEMRHVSTTQILH